MIDLDQRTFDTRMDNDIIVTLDGKVIRHSQNPLEVLSNSGSQEGDAVYCIERTLNGSLIMIYVRVSRHTYWMSQAYPHWRAC